MLLTEISLQFQGSTGTTVMLAREFFDPTLTFVLG